RGVEDAIRTRPGRETVLEVERGGAALRIAVEVEPRSGLDEFGGTEQMGWAGLGHRRPRALLSVPDAGSPAHAAGLRSFDLVVAVAGKPVEDWHQLAEDYAAAPAGGAVALDVERGAVGGVQRLAG